MFKRADLGRNLGRRNIRDDFKKFSISHAHPRSEIVGVGVADNLGKAKNLHDIFINLDSAIEIAVHSKKPRAVVLVKWLTKKGVEKIQEKHQQAITGRNNQMQAIEFTNQVHQQET